MRISDWSSDVCSSDLVLLQNRGCGFVLDPTHPNCVSPRKRPLHTIIPGMIADHGQCDMVYGVMGGAYQAEGHAHFVTNVLDFEMDVQAAIDAPRIFHFDGRIEAEDGRSEERRVGKECVSR